MAGVHFLDARGPQGMRLYAIGDVHGRLDLLSAMHARIHAEIMRDRPADWRIIHLGDYVDRGPDARGVITFLIERMAEDERVVALAGNHDVGLIDFLARPEPHGLFARNGGAATARSYGVEIDFASPDGVADGARRLAAAIPPAHAQFLRALPLSVEFGDFFFCHAGIRPGIALDEQDPGDLVWIREDFLFHLELHPKVVVHGHTPHDVAEVLPNRVNVDTLAYASGRLTALVVDGEDKRLLEATHGSE
ncbi:metallophosphoesterase [Mesorhizobium xinjiangense]|uniref:metallophosphoesterase n=1 Tax=Mesorhizobium xinjiangense TaxID=2678685 RepID=UPI0012EE9199|nr:metallophosphoesterase [Mesorhizobium xinjiangense]